LFTLTAVKSQPEIKDQTVKFRMKKLSQKVAEK
jgi:hypothetical protein